MENECPKCQTNNPNESKFCMECATPLPHDVDITEPFTKTLDASVIHLTRGSTFAGRYEIIEKLGKGGMGKVYRVLDTKLNEEVALKLIKPEIASDKKTVERFRNELKIARKIVQKNVGRMFDLNEEKDTLYITMEYVPGQDLRGLIRQSGMLAIPTVISIAKQMCDGLAEAHRIGVIHRDLKPSNIMIDKKGNVRIMDFGIARSLEAKVETGTGVIIGTPKYMSPEQMEGKEVDQRSDIYSLGVILYKMATGKAPFKGDSSLSIAMQHKLDSPNPPMELNRLVPEPLNRLILKCLEKKKENRYQSADETLVDLKVIEDDLTTGEKQIPIQKRSSTSLMTSIKTFKVPGYLIMGALILLALAYFIGKSLTSEDRPIRIVIFPFEYVGPVPDADQLYIRDYLARGIGSKLQERYEGLIITAENSAEFYATSGLTNPEIGAILNVDYILKGNIRIDQLEVNMSISIIDAKQDVSIESIPSSCSIDEIFDKGVIDIADKIGRKLGAASSSSGLSLLQADSDAMDSLARGWFAERTFRETGDEQDFQAAEQFYLSAVEKQKDYALYSWHLGRLYELRYWRSHDKSDQQKMSDYFRSAYDLEDNSAETKLGMGWVSFYEGKNDSAYQYFLKAYELDSKKFEVNYNIGAFLQSVGLYEK
ncbi:MAG: protein kinase, partial [Candidatus Aminicenantaceae bacterium]